MKKKKTIITIVVVLILSLIGVAGAFVIKPMLEAKTIINKIADVASWEKYKQESKFVVSFDVNNGEESPFKATVPITISSLKDGEKTKVETKIETESLVKALIEKRNEGKEEETIIKNEEDKPEQEETIIENDENQNNKENNDNDEGSINDPLDEDDEDLLDEDSDEDDEDNEGNINNGNFNPFGPQKDLFGELNSFKEINFLMFRDKDRVILKKPEIPELLALFMPSAITEAKEEYIGFDISKAIDESDGVRDSEQAKKYLTSKEFVKDLNKLAKTGLKGFEPSAKVEKKWRHIYLRNGCKCFYKRFPSSYKVFI